jgi:hypothetical protein
MEIKKENMTKITNYVKENEDISPKSPRAKA